MIATLSTGRSKGNHIQATSRSDVQSHLRHPAPVTQAERMAESEFADLTGKLLIAMPGMTDPRFEKSVVLLCEHSPGGAMGLIVNKPAREVDSSELLKQLEIDASAADRMPGVHFGGPVEMGRGFVLHSAEYDRVGATLPVTADVSMTATLDILHDIGAGKGPEQAILALGYAGWGPGQLESELQENGWLTADSKAAIVLDADAEAKWARALAILGIDPLTLSAAAGRA